MRKDTYRMASWWLLWEDLLFPGDGIEDKHIRRAKKFSSAGIDTVVICGCHFRWDYIYNWERLHQLLEFIVETCHSEGIKVFGHHSANLTHRVDTLDDYRNIYRTNRHHVPFFPSREFADTITYNGHKLNDFRMVSVRDGKPCYLKVYNAEIFCMNNSDFAAAYRSYVEQLLKTGIDGLMCDDIIYYPSWDACGCIWCRDKFKSRYGHELPPVTDESFWGNYESPAFKDWIHMRYHDPLDFLTVVKETVGAAFPLMSCCSNSSAKSLNGSGMNAEIMCRSLNNVMLEICGEIVSREFDVSRRIPDFILHKAVADKYNCPNIGLGYAHNPDSAFVIWALNKLFGSNSWISTMTGRFGVSEEIRKTIPDEADVIQEAYNFEKLHPDLFDGESCAKLAVMFSLDNLMYNGCAQADYSQPWRDITAELFKLNIQFDVVLDIPSRDRYPVLLLSNFNCFSTETDRRLLEYLKQGGTIIAAGPTGFRNERGELRNQAFPACFGKVEFRPGSSGWKIAAADLFDPKKHFLKNSPAVYEIYSNGIEMKPGEWVSFGAFHWLPVSSASVLADKVKQVLKSGDDDIRANYPEGWICRILKNGETGKSYVHLLTSNIKIIPHKTFRNTMMDYPVIEKLKFMPGSGCLKINSSAVRAVLYSPDLPEPVELKGENGNFSFELKKISRYLLVELCN